MTDKQIKLIYDYMGWDGTTTVEGYCIDTTENRILDSNSAWEVVQELERKGDYLDFESFVFKLGIREKMKDKNFNQNYYLFWILNPENFFNCFAKWLEGIVKREIKRAVTDTMRFDS